MVVNAAAPSVLKLGSSDRAQTLLWDKVHLVAPSELRKIHSIKSYEFLRAKTFVPSSCRYWKLFRSLPFRCDAADRDAVLLNLAVDGGVANRAQQKPVLQIQLDQPSTKLSVVLRKFDDSSLTNERSTGAGRLFSVTRAPRLILVWCRTSKSEHFLLRQWTC
jgi:hypothetical protein